MNFPKSYDYDCPITESGNLGGKYHIIRDLLAKHSGKKAPVLFKSPVPDPWRYHILEPSGFVSLFDALETINPAKLEEPLPMELIKKPNSTDIGEPFGYTYYSVNVSCSGDDISHLIIKGLTKKLKGRGHFYTGKNEFVKPILLEDEFSGERDEIELKKGLVEFSNFKLNILTENPGRINFQSATSLDGEYKGLAGKPILLPVKPENSKTTCSYGKIWDAYPLPMGKKFIDRLAFKLDKNEDFPGFHRFELKIRHNPRDTFIDPIASGFTKGVIFINGRNLGRFWRIGPQRNGFKNT